MTNNQRFIAELIVLVSFGALVWAKANPAQEEKQEAATVVRAQRFELVDKIGRTRGYIGFNANKEPTVAILGMDNKPRIYASVDQHNGSTIQLIGVDAKKTVARLFADHGGGADMGVYHEADDCSAILTSGDAVGTALSVFDPDGAGRVFLGLKNGQIQHTKMPILNLTGVGGKSRDITP